MQVQRSCGRRGAGLWCLACGHREKDAGVQRCSACALPLVDFCTSPALHLLHLLRIVEARAHARRHENRALLLGVTLGLLAGLLLLVVLPQSARLVWLPPVALAILFGMLFWLVTPMPKRRGAGLWRTPITAHKLVPSLLALVLLVVAPAALAVHLARSKPAAVMLVTHGNSRQWHEALEQYHHAVEKLTASLSVCAPAEGEPALIGADWLVDRSGRLRDIVVRHHHEQAVAACVEQQLELWRLPPPPLGEPARIDTSFAFVDGRAWLPKQVRGRTDTSRP